MYYTRYRSTSTIKGGTQDVKQRIVLFNVRMQIPVHNYHTRPQYPGPFSPYRTISLPPPISSDPQPGSCSLLINLLHTGLKAPMTLCWTLLILPMSL